MLNRYSQGGGGGGAPLESVLTLSSPLAFPHLLMEGVYLGVKTCEVFLCSGVIVYLLYSVSRFIVVLVVLCFTSLVSFTGFYTEDEPMEAQKYYSLLKTIFQVALFR